MLKLDGVDTDQRYCETGRCVYIESHAALVRPFQNGRFSGPWLMPVVLYRHEAATEFMYFVVH